MDKTTIISKTGWNFDHSYARLPSALYSKIDLNPVTNPELVILNLDLAEKLGLNVEALQEEESVSMLGGNSAPMGVVPIAQAYAGHQYGHFTMLGDGRALLLGEHMAPNGERVDIQLKGSGRTPYSRGGDGRATLGPMLQEYIISEAMYALGIPTTRSLAVTLTGDVVYRENEEEGAILTRVASSHIRVGTFQYVKNFYTELELRILADYTIKRHFNTIDPTDEHRYRYFLREVIDRQASLIAKWQCVGFIHGVMNTDNMTISGETIDYGPCAFMDTYDPETVFSSIDSHGRYAYGNQPYIASWNLARFAETILPLLHEDEEEAIKLAQEEISKFGSLYQTYWLSGMRKKLGLFNEEQDDQKLVEHLLTLMQTYQADFTNTFRSLTLDQFSGSVFEGNEEFNLWKESWLKRLDRQEQSKDNVIQLMKRSNPSVIPRNHLVEEALEAAVGYGDYTVFDQLLNVITEPFSYNQEHEDYCQTPEPSPIPYRTFCGT